MFIKRRWLTNECYRQKERLEWSEDAFFKSNNALGVCVLIEQQTTESNWLVN